MVMMGKTYWEGLIRWMEKVLIAEGTISPSDLDFFFLTDSPEDAVEYIIKYHRDSIRPTGERRKRSPLPTLGGQNE